MQKSSNIAGKFSGIVSQDVGNRITTFLRRMYPTKTADLVSSDTGIPADRIAKWLSGGSSPNVAAFVALACAYGPDLLAVTMPNPPEWLVKAKRDERLRVLGLEIEAKRREMAALE